MADSIESLIAQLGARHYSAPSSYKAPVYTKPNIGYRKVNLAPYKYTQSDFKSLAKKKKTDLGINFWDVITGTVGQVGGAFTNSAYKTIEDFRDKKKSIPSKIFDILVKDNVAASVLEGIAAGSKEQVKDWKDGKFTWGDIPGVGVLHGADKNWKRGHDIAGELGMKDGWKKTAAGIGLDIALDPLTYLTGGMTTATKLSKVAEVAKISELAKGVKGLEGMKFRNSRDFLNAAKEVFEQQAVKYPNMADKLVTSKVNKLANELKTAKNSVYNKNINKFGLSVPFSNKATISLGNIPKWNPIFRTEATLGSKFENVAQDIISKVAGEGGKHTAAITDAVLKRYGVKSLKDLTKTHIDDLTNRLAPILPKSVTKVVDPVISSATKNTAEVGKAIKGMGDNAFNEMNNAKTKFEHMLDRKNPFDARTLKTNDGFLNSMANHVADASSQRIGEFAKYKNSLSSIDKYIKKNKVTPEDMEQAIYVLEKHAPNSLGGSNWVAPAHVKELADKIRPLLDEVGQHDNAAGVLDKLKTNYFPHVVNHNEELTKQMAEFAKKNPKLGGMSATNKFGKQRVSFQTLAARDNYMASLEKAIQKETNPDKIESLRKQQDRVAEMFDTDIVSALTRRIKEGVRARSMKAMQGKLSKFGMMKTVAKGETKPDGLQKLSAEEAKKLGLGEGDHFVQPDVLEGMKRIDEIFTSKGMNTVVRHVTAIADIWRPLVTYYKPSHYRNNLIGNTINNLAAGVTLRENVQAGKLLARVKSNKLSAGDRAILDSAYKHNVISGGYLQDNHATYRFDDPIRLERIAQKVGDNKIVNYARSKGEWVDDHSRLANFINGLNKFGDTEKAAGQVREYLFNYNELTNSDRLARVAVPFWNWTKRNIPLQMKLLMENPKYALNADRFNDLFNEGRDGEDWQKKSGIHVPKALTDLLGTGEHYTTVPNPVNDLSQLFNPREFAGSITPAAKVPIEMMMNKKFFTGKPISYGSDNLAAEDIPQYLLSNMGIGGNAYDAFSGKKSVIEALTNLLNPISKVNPVGQ